jgi:hypothetical protein
MRPEAGPIRESEGAAACPRCGAGASGWEHGIPIEAVVAAIAADRALLGAMEGDGCRACGAARGWDAVTGANGGRHGADGSARRGMLLAIRVQLALGRRPDAIATWIRRELGVVGIVVEDRSEVGRRLGLDCAPRPGDLPSGR